MSIITLSSNIDLFCFSLMSKTRSSPYTAKRKENNLIHSFLNEKFK